MADLTIDRIQADTRVLQRTKSLSVIRDRLIADRFSKRVRKFFDCSYSKKQTLKVIDYVQNKIVHCPDNQDVKKALVNFGNKVISIFFSNSTVRKAILVLDRALALIRVDHNFLLSENKKLCKKWESYGFKKELFYKHSEFSNFLMASPLASQMKITNDGVREINSEPAILVEGTWTKFSDLKNRFFYKYSPKYNEIFIFEKKTNQVFTYLPNKSGLCLHHPYLHAFKPVGKLTRAEYNKVLVEAQKFGRDYKLGKSKYKHILQIVTSQTPEGPCFYNRSNLASFFRTKHPYFRIIDANTKEVYILGYGLWRRSAYNFLTNFIGRFRSLDVWEYKKCKQKHVTNIAIADEEIKRFFYYCKKFINDDINFGRKIAFNFMKQNCTSFIKEAIEYALKEKIITDLGIDEIIYYIAPDFLRRVGAYIKNSVLSIKIKMISVFPTFIKTSMGYLAILVHKFWKAFVALGLSIIASFLGAIRGVRGRKLKNPDKQIHLYPPLQNIFNWFNYSSFKFDMPGKLFLWQLKQKSTVTFKNPRTLTIVPN